MHIPINATELPWWALLLLLAVGGWKKPAKKAKAKAPQQTSDAAGSTQDHPSPDPWQLLGLAMALWHVGVVSFSDAPLTEGSAAKLVAAGAAFVLYSKRAE